MIKTQTVIKPVPLFVKVFQLHRKINQRKNCRLLIYRNNKTKAPKNCLNAEWGGEGMPQRLRMTTCGRSFSWSPARSGNAMSGGLTSSLSPNRLGDARSMNFWRVPPRRGARARNVAPGSRDKRLSIAESRPPWVSCIKKQSAAKMRSKECGQSSEWFAGSCGLKKA